MTWMVALWQVRRRIQTRPSSKRDHEAACAQTTDKSREPSGCKVRICSGPNAELTPD